MIRRVLDLFCGAGGAAMGYYRAFGPDVEIVGIDIVPMPRYPFTFIQADALEYVAAHGNEFDFIHASPPCQGYSRMRHLPWLKDNEYPLLIPVTRLALQQTGKTWIIENVADAPLAGATLCGAALGLPISRHRRFESNILLLFPPCPGHEVIAHGRSNMATKYPGHVTGIKADDHWRRVPGVGHNARWREAAEMMGIDWMARDELSQAIPPAYTEWIGRRILEAQL